MSLEKNLLGISRFRTLQKRTHSFSVASSSISDYSEVEEGFNGDSASIFTGLARVTGALIREMRDI